MEGDRGKKIKGNREPKYGVRPGAGVGETPNLNKHGGVPDGSLSETPDVAMTPPKTSTRNEKNLPARGQEMEGRWEKHGSRGNFRKRPFFLGLGSKSLPTRILCPGSRGIIFLDVRDLPRSGGCLLYTSDAADE